MFDDPPSLDGEGKMATTCPVIDDDNPIDATVRQMARSAAAAAHDHAVVRSGRPRREPRATAPEGQDSGAPPALSPDLAAIYALLADHTPRGDHMDLALCRFVTLLPILQQAGNPCLVLQGRVVATYLVREDAAPSMRRRLVDDLACKLELRRRVPAVHIMAGLGCFLLLLALAASCFAILWQSHPWDPAKVPPAFFIFNVSPWLVLAVAVAGGLGSMISMFSRLESYASLVDMDVRLLWLIGAVKPVMGVVLALFVFTVLQSKILPFSFDESPQTLFTFVAVAFLAGFSERFSRVVAARVEARFLGPESAPAAPLPAR
jgi:hypothetical protein